MTIFTIIISLGLWFTTSNKQGLKYLTSWENEDLNDMLALKFRDDLKRLNVHSILAESNYKTKDLFDKNIVINYGNDKKITMTFEELNLSDEVWIENKLGSISYHGIIDEKVGEVSGVERTHTIKAINVIKKSLVNIERNLIRTK